MADPVYYPIPSVGVGVIQGASVASVAVDGNGHLIFTLTNGSTLDAGNVNSSIAALVTAQMNNYIPRPASGTTAGFVPTVQSDGTVAYRAQSGGSGGISVTDNNDGTLTLASGGSSTVTDNNDGTLVFS